MINLKLLLKPYEVRDLGLVLNELLKVSQDKIEHTDYFNIRYFLKQLVDKDYKITPAQRSKGKQINLPVNINVYKTVKKLFKLYNPLGLMGQTYYINLLRLIEIQLDKQYYNIRNEQAFDSLKTLSKSIKENFTFK